MKKNMMRELDARARKLLGPFGSVFFAMDDKWGTVFEVGLHVSYADVALRSPSNDPYTSMAVARPHEGAFIVFGRARTWSKAFRNAKRTVAAEKARKRAALLGSGPRWFAVADRWDRIRRERNAKIKSG